MASFGMPLVDMHRNKPTFLVWRRSKRKASKTNRISTRLKIMTFFVYQWMSCLPKYLINRKVDLLTRTVIQIVPADGTFISHHQDTIDRFCKCDSNVNSQARGNTKFISSVVQEQQISHE